MTDVEGLVGADGIAGVALVPQLHAHLFAMDLQYLEREVAVLRIYFGGDRALSLVLIRFVLQELLNQGCLSCLWLPYDEELLKVC